MHGLGIHDPGHGLFVGAYVRRGNVALGTKPFTEFASVAAGDALEFGLRKLGGIADHAALRATEGNVDDGALPRHPRSEGADFVDRDVWRETDAAFAGAAYGGMKDAVADENFEAAVIHRNRQVDGYLLAGVLEVAVDAVLKAHLLSCKFEARFGGLIDVQLFLRNRTHTDPPGIARAKRKIANLFEGRCPGGPDTLRCNLGSAAQYMNAGMEAQEFRFQEWASENRPMWLASILVRKSATGRGA